MNNTIPEHIIANQAVYRKRWLLYAPIGLLLIGFGLCVFGTALFKMRDQAPITEWFLWGTASLVLINAGLCFFGQAVKYSILHELTRHQNKTGS
jgi:hypothetical protein